MTASIGKSPSRNPRAMREMSTPVDWQKWRDWDQIMQENKDDLRVDFSNLEGDFPAPSKEAPDQGVLQYYYHLDADNWYRPRRQILGERGSYLDNTTPDNAGTPRSAFSIYAGSTTIVAPYNNSWVATLELDDARRDMQNVTEHGIMSYEITPPAQWLLDEDGKYDNLGDDQYKQTGEIINILPTQLIFTTNAEYVRQAGTVTVFVPRDDEDNVYNRAVFVPAGSLVEITYNTQEESGIPNEDLNYLSVTANDASWERNRPTTVNFLGVSQGYEFEDVLNDDGDLALTWKPLENPADQPAKVRVLSTNYSINEEGLYGPYGYSKLTDTHLYYNRTIGAESESYSDNRANFDNFAFDLEAASGSTEEAFLLTLAKAASIEANHYPVNHGYRREGVWTNNSPRIKHFWSAMVVNYFLTKHGYRGLRTQSALDYIHYGKEVDWRDWNNVRQYDIAVFKFKKASGGHVGFIKDVDLSTNKVKILGGNQSNKFKETEYLIDSVNMYLLTVRRGWDSYYGLLPGLTP